MSLSMSSHRIATSTSKTLSTSSSLRGISCVNKIRSTNSNFSNNNPVQRYNPRIYLAVSKNIQFLWRRIEIPQPNSFVSGECDLHGIHKQCRESIRKHV